MNYDQLYEGKQDTYYLHSRPEMLSFVPENIKTGLDVGCSNGAFGQLLKDKFSCTVWGIEPNQAAAQEAEKKLDKVINSLFLKDMPELAGQKFDAIFFNDVLEHLVDPEEALNTCKKILNKGGCVIASLPNIRWYPVMLSLIRYKDFKYTDSGVMDKTHLHFFTSKSMCRMFETCGYKVIKVEGINNYSNFKFFNILNFLTFGSLSDMKFPQFGLTALLIDKEG